MRVRLHIDQLVLKGVDARDPGALAAGMQREFTRRLSVPGVAERLTRQDAATHLARDAVRAAISKGRTP